MGILLPHMNSRTHRTKHCVTANIVVPQIPRKIHAMSLQFHIEVCIYILQRRLGGLIEFLPFTYITIIVGSLSLLATPQLTGFYSKDLIIELAYGQNSFSETYAFILESITANLTFLQSIIFQVYLRDPLLYMEYYQPHSSAPLQTHLHTLYGHHS